MKNYLEHIKNTRTPHERRTHALQAAGVITAAVFAVWLGTLPWRLAVPGPVAQDDSNQTTLGAGDKTSLSASAAAATQNNRAHLEVSTTSIYSQ